MSNGVWTNNWKGIKNWMLLGPYQASSVYRSGWDTIKNISGTVLTNNQGNYPLVVSPVGKYGNSNVPGQSSDGISNAIVFGTGNATPDATDYCLAAKWTSGISRVSMSQTDSYDDATHTKTVTVQCTVQNTGSTPVTIREWGIETEVLATGVQHVLLYHALLDTPVTLNQYESATFTATISLRLTDPI